MEDTWPVKVVKHSVAASPAPTYITVIYFALMVNYFFGIDVAGANRHASSGSIALQV